METETIKVKPWGKGQGDFVEINKGDSDPKVHALFEEAQKAPTITAETLRTAIDALPAAIADGEYAGYPGITGADYVVNQMRGYFGDLFTAAAEAEVRVLFPKPADSQGGSAPPQEPAKAASQAETPPVASGDAGLGGPKADPTKEPGKAAKK